jgi:hypothetical protein
MKQLLASVLVMVGLALGSKAAAQQLRFYYYPSSNVYYDPVHKQYIYPSNGTWVTGGALPSRAAVLGTDRVTVYSQTPQVWRYNATHKAKYKGKSATAPQGKAVGYKGTNPNKAQGKTTASKGKAKGKG